MPILARKQLEISQLHLLGSDVDIDSLKAEINGKFAVDLAEPILAASVSRTIDGASTLSVTVSDHDFALLNSGRLNQKVDINIDGLWFRFRAFSLEADNLELKFEEREIAVLRTYSKIIPPVSRTEITRAEFILRMIKEVKEFKIDYYIPELHDTQPVDSSKDLPNLNFGNLNKEAGLPAGEKLTVKHESVTDEQLGNAEIILRTGNAKIDDLYPNKRKILVCSIMTAIQESTLKNLLPGSAQDGSDSQGIFQQRPSQGWPNSMDVTVEATAFFDKALAADRFNPAYQYTELCQAVQRSAFPRAYGKWRVEAEQFVRSFGVSGGDKVTSGRSDNNQKPLDPSVFTGGTGTYFFYRGKAPTRGQVGIQPENSWECIQRLAQEVGWRAFFISGRFYYMSEDLLFRQRPAAILDRNSDGVDDISGDYDQNKKIGNVDISCRMGRFACSPGSVIKLENLGPLNGRWIVETIDRDLYQPQGALNLKKADPLLPEPAQGDLPTQFGQNQFDPASAKVTNSTGQPVESGDVRSLADKIVAYYDQGAYRDDNGSQIAQWRKVSEGKLLHNQCGQDVPLNAKIAQALLFLLDNGWLVGTYAVCEDHGCNVKDSNRQSQHAKGEAVDISSLGQQGVGWRSLKTPDDLTTEWIKTVMVSLRSLNPSQIICNGVGRVDKSVQDLQWNNGQQVSYITGGHTNHMHFGA